MTQLPEWVFDPLVPLSFDIIMGDPPWKYKLRSTKGEAKAPQAHYQCMDLKDIQNLPVNQLASKDCLLWLWCTNPMIKQGIETMEAWGFTFKTMGTWNKRHASGKLCFGTGYILRSSSEPFIIGTVGKPKTSNNIRSSFDAERREHSRKPELSYDMAERLVPSAQRRLDLFSREPRDGWQQWGNEIHKFHEEA